MLLRTIGKTKARTMRLEEIQPLGCLTSPTKYGIHQAAYPTFRLLVTMFVVTRTATMFMVIKTMTANVIAALYLQATTRMVVLLTAGLTTLGKSY